MYQLAVCDDDKYFLNYLENILKQYFKKNEYAFQIHLFDNAENFLGSELEIYDIILLDVKMDGIDGIETAKILRNKKLPTVVIYISSYIEMAPSGYQVQAFRYLLKENVEKTLTYTMDEAVSMLNQQKEVLTISFNYQKDVVLLSEIIYIESFKRYVVFHITEGELKQYGKISDWEKKLDGKGFLRIQKSYIVNMRHINKMHNRKIYLKNGVEINCNKAAYKELQSQYVLWKGRHLCQL